jgi:hypothetical protein
MYALMYVCFICTRGMPGTYDGPYAVQYKKNAGGMNMYTYIHTYIHTYIQYKKNAGGMNMYTYIHTYIHSVQEER